MQTLPLLHVFAEMGYSAWLLTQEKCALAFRTSL